MRLVMTLCYDGTGYNGYQSQKDGSGVQDAVEKALSKIFKRSIRIHAASRTDSSVHAMGQVAHFDADWRHPLTKLLSALNTLIPDDIQIVQLKKVDSDFHARFSAKAKRYVYTLKTNRANPFERNTCWGLPFKIDKSLLRKAMKTYEGKHDFTAFAGKVKKAENPVKRIDKIKVSSQGDFIKITIQGSGFLYKMVRTMVGFGVEVARGKASIAQISHYLKNPKRTHEIITAPAQGLCLQKVFYPIAKLPKKN